MGHSNRTPCVARQALQSYTAEHDHQNDSIDDPRNHESGCWGLVRVYPLINTARGRDPAIGTGCMVHVKHPDFHPPPESPLIVFSGAARSQRSVRGKSRWGLVAGTLPARKPVLAVSWFLDVDKEIVVHRAAVHPLSVDWTPTPAVIVAAWTKKGGLNHLRMSVPTPMVREWIRMYQPVLGHDLAHRLLPRRRVGEIEWVSPLHIVLTVELFKKEIPRAIELDEQRAHQPCDANA